MLRWPVLYEDRRLVGVCERSLVKPKDYGMRLPDVMKRCVFFLYVQTEDGAPIYGGTGFFVRVPGADPAWTHYYLVTAKHNMTGAREVYDDLHVRYTGFDNATYTMRVGFDWKCPEDEAVDVAVLPFRSWRTGAGIISGRPQSIPIDNFVTTDALREHKIGVGDTLSILGLFLYRWGEKKNIPIVRSGVIAAMMDEPIHDPKTKRPFHAYLAEVKSIGGLSGSPVFVDLVGFGRDAEGEVNEKGRHMLLGLIRGHWDYESPLTARGVPDTEAQMELKMFNTGIAMVTPIEPVAAILNSEVYVQERKDKENAAKPEFTEDSAFATEGERGPKPERLKIDEPMDDAVKKMLGAGKPPRGLSD
jgi:hypothetical protein